MKQKRMVSTTTVRARAKDIELLAQDIIANPDDYDTIRHRLSAMGGNARAINQQFVPGLTRLDTIGGLIDKAWKLASSPRKAGNKQQLKDTLKELRLTWGVGVATGFDTREK